MRVKAIETGIMSVHGGFTDERTFLKGLTQKDLLEYTQPVLTTTMKPIGLGLGVTAKIACGIVVTNSKAVPQHKEPVILFLEKTAPHDVAAFKQAAGIIVRHGGFTSHAAIVARGMNKCCIVGVTLTQAIKEGQHITVDGSTGKIYNGILTPTNPPFSTTLQELQVLLNKHNKLEVQANADEPFFVKEALKYCKAVGLCRTEHMFFQPGRAKIIQQLVIAGNGPEKVSALKKLYTVQLNDFKELFDFNIPITVRLLDPPLHEFIPSVSHQAVKSKVARVLLRRLEELKETNPMLGMRGCRLGIVMPEITMVQVQALLMAASVKKYQKLHIMLPLISTLQELKHQKKVIEGTAIHYPHVQFKVGVMVETPRACFIASDIAPHVDFMSFGTNDLTQMVYGMSRDDSEKFLPTYLEGNILSVDPFKTLDPVGVGGLMRMAVKEARKANPAIKIGICGEHGGDPDSMKTCYEMGLDYVSCAPSRVMGVKLALAQCG